ncbi:hypothetical protein AVEN_79372-1 [Araneus ventricosus]|uniref:Uncharacterized protein n=1 Tax=Araneus ventricosus TaxID=182803 RepID=A0A4Y2X3R1_ARAVE|nr:hypothetical protein AVEN_79372-1 [Araneus ventricosus]
MANWFTDPWFDLCSEYGICLPERHNNTFWEEFLHTRAERILKIHYEDVSFFAILNFLVVYFMILLEYGKTVNSLVDLTGLHEILKSIISFMVFFILTVLSYLKWKMMMVLLTPEHADGMMSLLLLHLILV